MKTTTPRNLYQVTQRLLDVAEIPAGSHERIMLEAAAP